MTGLSFPPTPSHPRPGDERGSVAVIFAIMLVPFVAAIGSGVDFARAAQVEAALQGAVDSAALAGASNFNSTTCPAAAVAAASSYMTAAISQLPSGASATFTVATGSLTSGKATTAYTVAVTATAQVSTTFMSLFVASLPAAANATAQNPIVTASIQLGSFNSSAADKNAIAWYPVPCDNSVPPASALTTLFSNTGSNAGTLSMQITSTQRVGFALVNVTGGISNYGNNQYGGKPGSTHIFYSHLNPPSEAAYPSVGQNCSLQAFNVPTGQAAPTPTQGVCFTAPFAYAAPTCTQIGKGQTVWYDWNDMGGPTDDLDYNDAVYSFSCSTPSGSVGVSLLK